MDGALPQTVPSNGSLIPSPVKKFMINLDFLRQNFGVLWNFRIEIFEMFFG
jgi:hypothetical protein